MKRKKSFFNDKSLNDNNKFLKNDNREIAQNTQKQAQINFSSINSKSKSLSQHISLRVQIPVFEQYKTIDLKKTSSYKRIPRLKLKNRSIQKQIQLIKNSLPNNISIQQDSKGQYHQNSCIQIQKHQKKSQTISFVRPKTYCKEDETHWKQQILKYIQAKQKSLSKYKQEQGFPLMKLTRKNQLIRKMRTNLRSESQKPQFIKSLQKESLFSQINSEKKDHLPKIIQIKLSKKKIQKEIKNINVQIMHSHDINEIQNLKNKKSEQQKERGLKGFYDQALLKANKSEKILINFIGNYFKHKYCPIKRYSYQLQLPKNKDDEVQLKISNNFLDQIESK